MYRHREFILLHWLHGRIIPQAEGAVIFVAYTDTPHPFYMRYNTNVNVLLLIAGLGLAVIIGVLTISNTKPAPPPSVSLTPSLEAQESQDTRASFAIFTNGTFRVFTAAMYHNRSENVYIESEAPNIIQVKKSSTTWGDFFATLPMNVTHDCLTTGTGQSFCTNTTHALTFYINGKADAEALSRPIRNGDTLLISYGINNDPAIESQLKRIPTP